MARSPEQPESFSSCMRVIYHNWSATKQRPHSQSVAEISCHSVLSGDRIRQCETSSGSRHKDTDQCKSPFPSAGTAVSLFRAKTVQQRPLLPREVETWLPDCEQAPKQSAVRDFYNVVSRRYYSPSHFVLILSSSPPAATRGCSVNIRGTA